MKRPVALAVVTATLLSGCGPTTHLTVHLRPVSITVPRVLTPAITLVPPTTTPVPVSLPPVPPVTSLLPPATTTPQLTPPVELPADPCPKAGQFDVPAKPASPRVEGIPAAGSYVQSALGAYSSAGTVRPLNGTVDVTVRRLPSSTSTVGQKVDSWSVETRMGKDRAVEVYQLVHSSGSTSATSPGIYLVGLAWTDPVRGNLTFQPAGGGLWILPDPVAVATSAAQYAGAATDPDSLTTMALIRNVKGRKRIDACGKLIDTYTVEMSGTLVSPSQTYQVTWSQQLATAYGAADVESTFAVSNPVQGFTWTRTLRNTAVPAASR